MPFPIPKDDAAPVATWSVGEGVAIAAPAGTPELAVCAGTVVLHGIGGLGPSTPVLRCDQPLAGHEYVYYGFAGPRSWPRSAPTSPSASRSPASAPERSRNSSGPHLEIGFADPAARHWAPPAPRMLALLRAAYAG